MAIVRATCAAGICEGMTVQCDFCHCSEHRCGTSDISQAAISARVNGFITVFEKAVTPARWKCKRCQGTRDD